MDSLILVIDILADYGKKIREREKKGLRDQEEISENVVNSSICNRGDDDLISI